MHGFNGYSKVNWILIFKYKNLTKVEDRNEKSEEHNCKEIKIDASFRFWPIKLQFDP